MAQSPYRGQQQGQYVSSAPASPPRAYLQGNQGSNSLMRSGANNNSNSGVGGGGGGGEYAGGGGHSTNAVATTSHRPSVASNNNNNNNNTANAVSSNINGGGGGYYATGHRTHTFNPNQQGGMARPVNSNSTISEQYGNNDNNNNSGATAAGAGHGKGMGASGSSQSAPMSPAYNNMSASRSRNYPNNGSSQNHHLQPSSNVNANNTLKSPTSSTDGPSSSSGHRYPQQQQLVQRDKQNSSRQPEPSPPTHQQLQQQQQQQLLQQRRASAGYIGDANNRNYHNDALDITPPVSIIVLPPPNRISLEIDTPPNSFRHRRGSTNNADVNGGSRGGNPTADVDNLRIGETNNNNGNANLLTKATNNVGRTTSNASNAAAANANAKSGGGSCSGSVASSQAVKGPPKPYAGLFGQIGTTRSDREMRKSGWLEKFSVGRGFFPVRNWQRRWFQITADGLNYGKAPTGEMAVRTFIPFVQSRKPELRLCPVFLLPNVTPQLHYEATDAKVYYFGLRFEEKTKHHVLLLRTSAAEDRDQWVRFLAQFLHVGNMNGIPAQHPIDPSVQRLHDPEQLDLPERIALRRVVVDWDEGYQEYRHKHVDRVNRAISSGLCLGGNGGSGRSHGGSGANVNVLLRGGSARSNASRHSANEPPNNLRNNSVGSNPMHIGGGVSRTASGKSGANKGNTNNPNSNGNLSGGAAGGHEDHIIIGGPSASGTVPYITGSNTIIVSIMDDSHVLALSGMDPAMAKEGYFDALFDVEGAVDAFGGGGEREGRSGGNSGPPSNPASMPLTGLLTKSVGGNSGALGTSPATPYNRQARSFALTLPSAPPTPTNDDL